MPLPAHSRQKLGFDIEGLIQGASERHRFVITVMDYHCRWPEIAFVVTVTPEKVTDVLLTLFSREGYPS